MTCNIVGRFCLNCGVRFPAYKSEVKRGWGLYCSRSCARTAQNEAITNNKSSYAEKIRANGLINMRLRRGHLFKPSACTQCGKARRLDGHHEDYAKPADIEWLCRSCHMKRHYEILALEPPLGTD
jgi:hypothetical protein